MSATILLVDDEPVGLEVLKSLLTNQDYVLAFASNGFEALAKARELSPDLILLDVMMPGMDGFEVCRRLRADQAIAEVPVLLVTALDDRESRLQGIEAGADDFITKPIDRVELRTRVRSIIRLNRYRRLQEERAKLERQLQHLTALRDIDLAISASLNLEIILNVLLQHVIRQLRVDAAAILLLNPHRQNLEYAAGQGFIGTGIRQSQLRLGSGYAGQAVLERRSISVPDLDAELSNFIRQDLLKAENFRAYYVLPLLAKGQVKGVLEVFHRAPLVTDQEWLDFLEGLSRQAAIAIDNAQLFDNLQRSNSELTLAYDATIEGWSRALDLRDKETEGHSRRVTEMTLQLARAVGISDSELIHVRRGALLHDIGKLGIPDNILLKPGLLTEAEWDIMRKHPQYAYEMLSPITYLSPALDIPYCHHEKWDGSGYPRGLKGDQIPLAARVFAVADVMDALRSDRPYRPGWSEAEVRDHIQSAAGQHFDPQVVEAYLTL